jgi:predicted nucleic acid-binding protein
MALGLLIDTDVVIDYLRGLPEAVAYLENLEEALFISAVTVGELYAGIREGKERAALEIFLQGFEIVPVDDEIAKHGGLFRRDFGKSHGVGLADALIAASAEVHRLDLVSLNRKHFPMLPEMVVPYRKA